MREPIVRTLFEHGAFSAADTRQRRWRWRCLALGLPAHVLVKALSPAFFARATPDAAFRSVEGIAIAIVLSIVLGQLFGAGGIAAAIALGAWSNAVT